MKRSTPLKYVLIALTGGLGLLSAPLAADAGSFDSVTVDPSVGYQTLEGWGTSIAWFGNVIGGAPKIRTQVADLLFNSKTGLGLNIVRYNVGGGENPKYNFLQYRAAVPGFEPQPGKWDWTADSSQRWMLDAALQRGADEQEAFSNSPPYWMTTSGSVTGAADGGNNLKRSDYSAFATYLATVVQHFQTKWGVTFRTVEPFNEPMSNWWKLGGTQEGAHFGQGAQNRLIPLLAKDLKTNHAITMVSAPDDNSIDETYTNLVNYPKWALNDISLVNTHGYNGSGRGSLSSQAATDGKDLWMSEYGDGDETGLTMSEQILSDMQQMHPTAWVYWQALDGSSTSDNSWGMLSADESSSAVDSFTVNEKYYIMANYSKFIRPGDQFISVNDPQSLAAYDWRNQQLVIVSTNDTLQSRGVSFALSRFGTSNAQVKAYQTTHFQKKEDFASVSTNGIHAGKLKMTLPPFSVTTLVISGAAYSPAGTTFSVDTFAGPSSKTYSFTGRQVLLKGERRPNSGIVQISIDHGAFVDLDLYSATTEGDDVVYASSTLSSGKHTITIQNSGRKNPLSQGYQMNITAGEAVQG